VVVIAIANFIACLIWKQKRVERTAENIEDIENGGHGQVLPQPIELPQISDSANYVYEEPSTYAQLDHSRRVPIDENYQSLKSENHDQAKMERNFQLCSTVNNDSSERSDLSDETFYEIVT
jgi:hypothetical protein